MISHKHKFVFIHVEKVGGTSITRNLLEYSSTEYIPSGDDLASKDKHLSLIQYKELYKDYFHEYFKFAIVRNPWERELSLFYFLKKTGRKNLPKCLSAFLKERFFDKAKWDNAFLTYMDALSCDGDTLDDIDFIGKFENLQEDFNIICDKIKIPRQKLPHKNKTNHKHYTEYYDDEAKKIVAEKYAKDIEYFGYKFGE